MSEKLKSKSLLPLKLSRFETFHTAIVRHIIDLIESERTKVLSLWEKNLEIMIVMENTISNPSPQSLRGKAIFLMQNILKQQVGTKLLQPLSMRFSLALIVENCAKERSRIQEGLQAIDVANKIVEELKRMQR